MPKACFFGLVKLQIQPSVVPSYEFIQASIISHHPSLEFGFFKKNQRIMNLQTLNLMIVFII
jgi:hypothetical protein